MMQCSGALSNAFVSQCHDSKFVNINAGLAANQAMNKQQTEREQSQDSSICQLCTMTCIISLTRAGLWGSPPDCLWGSMEMQGLVQDIGDDIGDEKCRCIYASADCCSQNEKLAIWWKILNLRY